MDKKERQTAAHYSWKDTCDGWHFVKRDDLSVIVERMPPGTAEDRHYHRRARQFFYILSGQAYMRFTDHDEVLEAGTGIEVAPMEAHQMMNTYHDPYLESKRKVPQTLFYSLRVRI